MIHRFATLETAALFASIKRDQGYFAEVIHEHVGFLWGPLAMNGFGVIVSECAADEDERVPELPLKVPSLPQELSMALGMAVLVIAAIPLPFLGVGLLKAVTAYPLPALTFSLRMVLCSLLMVALSVFLSELTRVYRNPDHPLHELVQFSHATMTWLLILTRLVF